jgi:hypothetical protein
LPPRDTPDARSRQAIREATVVLCHRGSQVAHPRPSGREDQRHTSRCPLGRPIHAEGAWLRPNTYAIDGPDALRRENGFFACLKLRRANDHIPVAPVAPGPGTSPYSQVLLSGSSGVTVTTVSMRLRSSDSRGAPQRYSRRRDLRAGDDFADSAGSTRSREARAHNKGDDQNESTHLESTLSCRRPPTATVGLPRGFASRLPYTRSLAPRTQRAPFASSLAIARSRCLDPSVS